MLICRHCSRWDTEENWKETMLQANLFPEHYVCPDCGSEDVVPAARCAHCSDWVAEEDRCITTDDNGGLIEVCQDCYDKFYVLKDLGFSGMDMKGGEEDE